jgi:hypothetical protein
LTSSTHLLGSGSEVRDRLADIIGPSKPGFTEAQARSACAMLEEIAAVGGSPSTLQSEILERVRTELLPSPRGESAWQ